MRTTMLLMLFPMVAAFAASAHGPAAQPVNVLPKTFLRGYDPITAFFANARGPKEGGPEDHPANVLGIDPPPAGEYRWVDASTLIFKPAMPWAPLSSFRVTAGGETRTLVTLMVPPQSIVPADGASDLEPQDEITLTFPAPLAVEALARMVSFELRPLPGVEKRDARWLTPEDVHIKVLERKTASAPARYVFQLKRPVPDGTAVLTHVKLALDDASAESMASFRFSTKEVFRAVAAGCYSDEMPKAEPEPDQEEAEQKPETSDDESDDSSKSDEGSEQPATEKPHHEEPVFRARALGHVPGMLPLTLAGSRYTREQAVDGGTGAPKIGIMFSGELAPLTLTDVKALVHFTPAIAELTFTQRGNSLCLSGKIERDTLYQAVVSPAPIKDRQGRALKMEGESEFFFHFGGQPSFLRWSQAQGIVERFGPQVFPMTARRDARVDLRIYKVDPLDRSFWPFPSHPVLVDESTRPPGPGEEPPGLDELVGSISPADLRTRVLMLGSPPVSVITGLPVRREGGATDFGLSLKEHLASIAGADEPGTYLVGVRRLTGDTKRSYVRIQVTDLCLSTVEETHAVQFLVTSLKTGLPLAGATVELQGLEHDADSGAFRALMTGTTDARGMYRFEHHEELPSSVRRIVVRKDRDTLVLQPSDPPYAFANNHWHQGKSSWLNWLSKAPPADPTPSALLMGHLLTERPVYRPEEEVHIKGYLRVRDAGKLSLPPADKFELVVNGPGEKVWHYPVEITPEGSLYHRFLEKDLPTGDYLAMLRDLTTQTSLGGVSWKAEAYVIPRFEVELTGPDHAPMDRPFAVTATAKYYAGGRVVGQPTRWRVTQFPYVYTPPEEKGFMFSSDERFSHPGRFTSPGAIVKNDATDASGASVQSINPAIELDARPRRYVFECTVTGADEQTVTATRQVVALPAFVLGVKVERFQTSASQGGGATIAPEIVSVDPDGKLIAGQELSVRLLQRQWHSTLTETDFSAHKPRYNTDVVDREVFATKVVTGAKPVRVELPAATAGIYLVEVSARDKVGRMQLVDVDLYKGGPEALAWKKPEANVFETVPDKTLYEPGDTAHILLKSPYQSAHVLAVVEAPDGNQYAELEVTGGKAEFTLPIKNEYNPRIPLHFLLMRGRVSAGQLGGADLGKPGTMAATTWLKVDPRENRMEVKLTHPEKVLPGQEITIGIELQKTDGKPVGGEVTLWLVDQAVLSLGRERELDPLPDFIRDVKSAIAIRDTRNRTIGEVVTEENPGGGGSEEPGLLGRITPRKKFKTVPYYNPRIMVDASGKASVTFKLSDDLTNFKVRAVAMSVPDRFGFARSTIAVRLPVIVQPALPRFVRISDRFTAGGIGRVVEGDGGAGHYEVKAEGATVEGAAAGEVTWAKDKPLKLYVPLRVLAPPARDENHARPHLALTVGVQRDADGAKDAFQVELPILPDRDPVRAEVLKRLMPGQSLSFPEFDRHVRAGSVRQEALVTDQEPVLKMLAALDYLSEYTHQCTEQRVSQTYPLVALRRLLDAFHLGGGKERADEVYAETIDYLGKTLQSDGLYAFWPGTPGQVSLTAYVVEFLVEAKHAGRTFPERLLERPVAALKDALRSDYAKFVDGAAFTERCEALHAVTVAAAFEDGYARELAQKAAYLDPYGKAEVVLAYAAAKKGQDPALAPLKTSAWDNLVFKLRDGKEVYGGLQSEVPVPGGMFVSSETRTLATMVRALYGQDKANPRMQLLVDELLRTGALDGWGDTSSDAAALLALNEVVSTPRALATPPQFEIACASEKGTLVLDAAHPAAHYATSSVDPATITWNGGGTGGSFWAKLDVICTPEATGDTVAAKSDGFVVRHELVRVPADDAPPQRTWIENPGQTVTFRTGEVLEEHVQVINPSDRNFVAVVAPLAAGMEPLNPNLKTAPPESKPSAGLTREPSYAMYLDDEARFYYETLPAGTYDFYFRTRATVEGSFVQPGARAEMMYRTAVRGNAAGVRYVVQPREGK